MSEADRKIDELVDALERLSVSVESPRANLIAGRRRRHGIRSWTKRPGGKRAVRCECGWESVALWPKAAHQEEQLEALRVHVRSTWGSAA